MALAINCDMGEGFGLYRCGDDAAIMPFITLANVACGFHASDPTVMHKTVRLAKQHGVRVGAHPSLPDLQGFGRREMRMDPKELADCLIYQVGALKAFLDAEGMALNHIKPHGALYGMAARSEEIANAICDAADVFKVPLLGMARTKHEEVYTKRGFKFIPEFYVDLDYDKQADFASFRSYGWKDTGAVATDPGMHARIVWYVERVDAISNAPVFYGGINSYLQQVSGFFRWTPRWLDRSRSWRRSQ
jgi:UPF0271 protein